MLQDCPSCEPLQVVITRKISFKLRFWSKVEHWQTPVHSIFQEVSAMAHNGPQNIKPQDYAKDMECINPYPLTHDLKQEIKNFFLFEL